jgi:hypothetical protein
VRDGVLELEAVPAPLRLERRSKGLAATSDQPLPTLDVDDVRAAMERQRR